VFAGAYGGGEAGTIANSGKKKFESGQARPKKPLPKRNAGKRAPGDKPKTEGSFLKENG
jgi:hypothetical protein